MRIGYARVSTSDQSTEAQVSALRTAGCERVFVETASGAKADRRVLAEALEFLRPEDVLVVLKLDRVARSLSHLIEIMSLLKAKGIGFQSLTEEISTTTPGGKLLFHLMAAISEFERDLIRERTMHGLKAARAKGRVGGRPRRMTDDKIDAVRSLLENGTPVKDAAAAVGVSVPTVYRYLPGSAR
ncbi:recombinase family protein [Primorskyibacter sp. S87]|uniref:recombinase family protein n=1 Tax=Primorskyibacter sp. S87 TaxID=3415126 RepID=UPI003C7AB21E